MKIIVKKLLGNSILLQISPNEYTISIKNKCNYGEDQRLIFNGKILDNYKKIKDYNIINLSTIEVFTLKKGGLPITGAVISNDPANLAQRIIEFVKNTVTTSTKMARTGIRDAAEGARHAQIMTYNAAKSKADNIGIWSRFKRTMLIVFEFYSLVILARVILGFFSAPLEFIMLGIACIILSIVYVIWFILSLPPIYIIPYLIYFFVIYVIPWIVYCIVIIVLFAIISLVCLVLAGINWISGGSLKDIVLCQNSPAAWYETPNHHLKNKNERGIFCSKSCLSGYAPDSTGLFCSPLDRSNPSYCSKAEIMRLYTGLKNDFNYYFKNYDTKGNMRYLLSSPDTRTKLLNEYYLKKLKFMTDCEKSMSKFNYMPLSICSSLDSLQGFNAVTMQKLKNVCEQSYCNSDNSYPFCSLLKVQDATQEPFWIQVIKNCIYIIIFILIIILLIRILVA